MKSLLHCILWSSAVLIVSGCASPRPITFLNLHNNTSASLSQSALILQREQSIYHQHGAEALKMSARLWSINGKRVSYGHPVNYYGAWIEGGETEIELQVKIKQRVRLNNSKLEFQRIENAKYRETVTIPKGKEAFWKLDCGTNRPGRPDNIVTGANEYAQAVLRHNCELRIRLSDMPQQIKVGQDLKVVSKRD